jgi:hypothetical protein
MPYNINKYDGTLAAIVEDGTVDNTLDIRLIGRNYAGYGEVQNENLVHLLENFASGTEPPRKITGQIWYDTRIKKLKFFDGNKFKSAGGTEIGDLKPSGLSVGDFWYNTETNQLYSCSGDDSFVLIGPQAVQDAQTTELRSTSVDDENRDPHPIIKGIIDGRVIFLISKSSFNLPTNIGQLDPDFVENSKALFTRVKKGITLADVNGQGVSNKGTNNEPNYVYWGTASNAEKLNGFIDTDFIKTINPIFDKRTSFLNEGFTVGSNNDLNVFIDSTNTVIKNSSADKSIIFKTTVNVLGGGTVEKSPLKLQGLAVLPGSEYSTVGSNDNKFSNIYATNFNGNLTGTALRADFLNVGGDYRTGATGATVNTVAVRDGNGDITARRFIGTVDATTAISGGFGGALVYQSSPNLTNFLTIGTPNQVLAVKDGLPTWASLTSLINVGQADRITVTNTTSTNSDYYITFTSGKTSSEILRVDDDSFTYNPSTNTVNCTNFNGTASKAKYADLAEKYLPDANYEVGTVLMVGGEKEVTAAQTGFRAIGVVSEHPAYLMNNDLEGGVAVALKGRVPVKVSGSVIKGQRLVAAPNGTAQAFGNHNDAFAIALETNIEVGIRLVECIIL